MSASIEEDADTAAFALIHICIRNDNSCPICKRIYVSFHSSWEEATEQALAQITMGEERDRAHDDLMRGSSCWVDEWVRRCNGDRYLICPVESGTYWNMSESSEIDVGDMPIQDGLPAKFLALHITVNRALSCPDNIQYRVTLSHTVAEAAQHLTNACEQAIESDWYGQRYKLPEQDAQSLSELKPVWVEKVFWDSPNIGHHLQVIPIQVKSPTNDDAASSMELNKYCPEIQPEEWY